MKALKKFKIKHNKVIHSFKKGQEFNLQIDSNLEKDLITNHYVSRENILPLENKAIQNAEVTKSEQLEELAEEVEEELEYDFEELRQKAEDLGLNVGHIKKVSTLKQKIEEALKEDR